MSIRAINWAVGVFEVIDIPSPERLILLLICRHHQDKTGECYPSYDTLAQQSGYNRRTVIRHVKSLKSSGLIAVKKRRSKGHQESNQFVLFGSFKSHNQSDTRVTLKTKNQSDSGVTLKGRFQSDTRVTQTRVTPVSPDRKDSTKGDFEEGDVLDFPIQKVGTLESGNG